MATIKGKWKWNDVVYCNGGEPHEEYSVVGFKSNDIEFAEIDRVWNTGYHHLFYVTDDKQYIEVGTNINEGDDSYTVDEAYRVMDFGETEQEISEELYEFIFANATEYSPIAEKLVEVANNVPKVFEAGKQQGHGEGYKEGYNKGYNEGLDTDAYEEGKKAEHDTFWDAFQNANRRTWNCAFQNACWNDTTFYPKNDLIISGDAASLFRYCGITDLEGRLKECGVTLGGVTLDTSECTNLNCGFGESTLTIVPTLDLRKCTASGSTTGLFSGCKSLNTIRKLIVNETTKFSSTFQNCPELRNIEFDGEIASDISFWGGKNENSSAKLTYNSIDNIVFCLSNTAEGKTLTLPKTAVDEAFAWDSSDDGTKQPGSTNGMWHELEDSKPNWTIILA